jgi:hypothetical protein
VRRVAARSFLECAARGGRGHDHDVQFNNYDYFINVGVNFDYQLNDNINDALSPGRRFLPRHWWFDFARLPT